MTYINKNKSPFELCTVSGNQTSGSTPVFDTTTRDWSSFNSSTKKIETGVDTYGEAHMSPNSNIYGLAVVKENSSGTNYYLHGQIMPESSNSGAGSHGRGDDVAHHIGSEHLFLYSYALAISLTADTSRCVLSLMRLT